MATRSRRRKAKRRGKRGPRRKAQQEIGLNIYVFSKQGFIYQIGAVPRTVEGTTDRERLRALQAHYEEDFARVDEYPKTQVPKNFITGGIDDSGRGEDVAGLLTVDSFMQFGPSIFANLFEDIYVRNNIKGSPLIVTTLVDDGVLRVDDVAHF